MKANHNKSIATMEAAFVVASTTKIQKWKQITTKQYVMSEPAELLPVRQRYKNESKSQPNCVPNRDTNVVASTTKIQKWKQITTGNLAG